MYSENTPISINLAFEKRLKRSTSHEKFFTRDQDSRDELAVALYNKIIMLTLL